MKMSITISRAQQFKQDNSPLSKEDVTIAEAPPSESKKVQDILKKAGVAFEVVPCKKGSKGQALLIKTGDEGLASAIGYHLGVDGVIVAKNTKDGRRIVAISTKSSSDSAIGDQRPASMRLAKRQDSTWVKVDGMFFHFDAGDAEMKKNEKAIVAIQAVSQNSRVLSGTTLEHPHLYGWREVAPEMESPSVGLASLLAKSEPPLVGGVSAMAKENSQKIKKVANGSVFPKTYMGKDIKPTVDLGSIKANLLTLASGLGISVRPCSDMRKSEAGIRSYRQGCVYFDSTQPQSHQAWQISHEIAHAITSDLVTASRSSPLTKSDAQQILAWEVATMELQKDLLEAVGVKLSNEAWARETSIVLADTARRLAKSSEPISGEVKPVSHWKAVVDALGCKNCKNLTCKCEMKKEEMSSKPAKRVNPNSDYDIEDIDDRLAGDQLVVNKNGKPPLGQKIDDKPFDKKSEEGKKSKGEGSFDMKKAAMSPTAPTAPSASISTAPPAPATPPPAMKGLSGSTIPKPARPVGRPSSAPQIPAPPLGKEEMLPSDGEPSQESSDQNEEDDNYLMKAVEDLERLLG